MGKWNSYCYEIIFPLIWMLEINILEVAVFQIYQEYFLVYGCGASIYVDLIPLFAIKAKLILACHEGIWGSGCLSPLILNHCTR
jgi:hypothetical protein